MQELTPKVVATAVRMVMTMLMIFCQSSCLFMVCLSYELLVMSFSPQRAQSFTGYFFTTEGTEFHGVF